MNPPPASSDRPRAARVYRRFLQLYPPAFRRRYGEEMTEIFEQDWRRAQSGGWRECARFGLRLGWDLARTAGRERTAQILRLDSVGSWAWLLLGALAASFLLPAYGTDAGWRCALFVAYINLHPGDFTDFWVAAVATAANAGTPLVLAFLAAPGLRSRLPRFTPWLLLLFAIDAGYFFRDFGLHPDRAHPLSLGYYLWWACQVAAAGLAFWHEARSRPASVVARPWRG